MKPLFVLLVLLAGAAFTRPASAAREIGIDTVGCKIVDRLPYVISSRGNYCLQENLDTSITNGVGITITSSNVRLDCRGFEINGSSAGMATLAGGISSIGKSNITVRNCGVRGFRYGAILAAGVALAVEDSVFLQNTHLGLTVFGQSSIIQRNRILDTGGATVAIEQGSFGMQIQPGVDVIDNSISGVHSFPGSTATVFGVVIYYGDSSADTSVVRGNRIAGLAADGDGQRHGVYTLATERILFADNTIVFSPTALSEEKGIKCGAFRQYARNNTFVGFLSITPAFVGCGASGNVLTE
jgi:hypothetical protein